MPRIRDIRHGTRHRHTRTWARDADRFVIALNGDVWFLLRLIITYVVLDRYTFEARTGKVGLFSLNAYACRTPRIALRFMALGPPRPDARSASEVASRYIIRINDRCPVSVLRGWVGAPTQHLTTHNLVLIITSRGCGCSAPLPLSTEPVE